ncbi:MAG: CAP domain-containing protein [bacterium]
MPNRIYEKRLLDQVHALSFAKKLIANLLVLASILASSARAQSEKSENGDYLSILEKEVFREINLARTQPAAYAVFVDDLKRYYKGKLLERPGEPTLLTEEGISAVAEAARFLRAAKPVPALVPSRGLSLAAKDHVRDQGPRGAIGHRSRDGSQIDDRINRYGRWLKAFGENISYGEITARMIVVVWIIDDGVPDRGHRQNIFEPDFRMAGIACGDHAAFKSMCVVDFVGGYQEGK